jgi:rod shape determining protein RodA
VDRTLLFLTLTALMAGLVVLYTASAQGFVPGAGGDPGAGYLMRRVVQMGIGLALLALAAASDYRWLRRLIVPGAMFACGLLLAVLFTEPIRGTRGWLFGFQVVDLARLALLLFLADRLAARESERDPRRRFLWPLIAVAATTVLVALQPDLGSILALVLCSAFVLITARPPLRWVLAAGLIACLLAVTAYFVSDRVQERVDLVLHFDPNTSTPEGYQLRQSLIGLGAGGALGQGVGLGRQQRFLPDHHTDFILSIVGEEYGLLGTVGLLLLLMAIPLRILALARRQRDPYACYLAIGVGGMLFIYTSLNIAVAVGLFPVTGVPLPFISHGGSALVMNLLALGLVLGASREREAALRQGTLRRARRAQPVLEDLYRGGRA